MNPQNTVTPEALYKKLMKGEFAHSPAVVVDHHGDCVRFKGSLEASNAVWIDSFLTLFFSVRNGEVVGFKVKNFRTILAALRGKGALPQPLTFGHVVDCAASLAKQAEQKKRERDLARNSSVADVEIPVPA